MPRRQPAISRDREWVQRGTDPAGDLEGWSGEEEVPDPVAGAVRRQRVEVEHLPEGEPHVADAERVDRQGEGRVLERDYLDRAGVGRHRGDLPGMEPWHALDAETRHAAHVALAVAAVLEDGQMPGANEEHGSPAALVPGGPSCGVQLPGSDALSRSESLDAAGAGEIEQHAA